jgi:hypothetical protein
MEGVIDRTCNTYVTNMLTKFYSGLLEGLMIGPCVFGNEILGFIKGGKFLYQQSDSQLSRGDTLPSGVWFLAV